MVIYIRIEDHPESEKHIKFVKWMKENDSNLSKTRILIYKKDFRGLHATTDIRKNKEILSVPIKLSISSDNFEETALGKKIVSKNIFDSKWDIFINPLIYVLEELNNPSSKYKLWLDILPEDANEHPAFYTETELEWLHGSPLVEQLELDKLIIKSFYDKIVTVAPEFAKSHSSKQFMTYYYLLCSRFFGLQTYNPRLAYMVPYADLANTGMLEERNASWDYDSIEQHFRLYSLKPIKAGEPIILHYGHSSNIVYMLYYGMALENEEYDAISFILKFKDAEYGDVKARLINQEFRKTKLAKFFATFSKRKFNNTNFMSLWRFFLYNGEKRKLGNVQSFIDHSM